MDTIETLVPLPAPAPTVAPWAARSLAVQDRDSHSIAAGSFANAGLKGPLEDFYSSGALDLTFACGRTAERAAKGKSAALDERGFTRADILWALGIWSAIICLSPVIVFYMLMVA